MQQQRQRKRELKLFDSLTLENKEQTFSKWRGDKGLYVFKVTESSADSKRSPVRQVYLNREYLTGLFKTKRAGEFSGDYKDSFNNSRLYLLFKVKSAESIDIFQKS